MRVPGSLICTFHQFLSSISLEKSLLLPPPLLSDWRPRVTSSWQRLGPVYSGQHHPHTSSRPTQSPHGGLRHPLAHTHAHLHLYGTTRISHHYLLYIACSFFQFRQSVCIAMITQSCSFSPAMACQQTMFVWPNGITFASKR